MRRVAEFLGKKHATLWIICIWATLCGGVALVGTSALQQISRQVEDDAATNAEQVARLLLANFERTSDSIDGFLTNFGAGFSPQWTASELFARIRNLNLPSSIVQLAVVDPDGKLIVSSVDPRAERVDVSDRQHIRVHRENIVAGLYISVPVFGRLSNLWTIQFTRAIRDGQGKLQAILVASYDLKDFISFYGGLNIGGKGVISLAGRDGIVRVRSAADVSYGHNLSASPRFQKILQERNGRIYGRSDISAAEQVGFFTTSDRYPFYTLVAYDEAHLRNRLATLRAPVIASLLGFAVVLTLAMGGALWAMRRQAVAAEQLHHTQRLEALGRLTGGIAHDFNNLLTIIVGSLDLLRRAKEDRRSRYIDNALLAAERAKGLTQQLLAFSRRQALVPAVTDLNRLVVEMTGLLTHSLRDDIAVEFDLAPELWPVRIDADQFQVALVNLAVNARDAMPNGGALRLQSRNLPTTDEVCLTVRDTGVGMSPEVAARVFEPFFTTKEVGKGTGLGLAQVHGFVHQSEGRLELDSTPGQGTAVSLFFPHAHAPVDAVAADDKPLPHIPAGLSVLVVDDNKEIAALATTALEEHGCRTQQAHTGANALAMLRQEQFDVLLTDIVMPGEMDGITLAKSAKAAAPNLAVVLMTGYSERLERSEPFEGELMLKPFSPKDLLTALQRALPAPSKG